MFESTNHFWSFRGKQCCSPGAHGGHASERSHTMVKGQWTHHRGHQRVRLKTWVNDARSRIYVGASRHLETHKKFGWHLKKSSQLTSIVLDSNTSPTLHPSAELWVDNEWIIILGWTIPLKREHSVSQMAPGGRLQRRLVKTQVILQYMKKWKDSCVSEGLVHVFISSGLPPPPVGVKAKHGET